MKNFICLIVTLTIVYLIVSNIGVFDYPKMWR
jgi:hypothetical protein